MRHMTWLALVLASISVSAQIPSSPTSDTADVIVRFKPSPDSVGQRRFAAHGASYKRQLSLIGAHVYTVHSRDLELLKSDPDVEYMSFDHPVAATSTLPPLSPDYGWMVALDLSSITATVPYDGTGIGVAVIDSGVTVSSDLQTTAGKSRVVYARSFVPGDSNTADAYGHGTMVAGLIGGNGAQSSATSPSYIIRGIARNVNLISLRVLDQNGSATDSTVIAAIQQAIA